MYEPVLDMPAIEATLRLAGVARWRWPDVLELLEQCFVAARRTWTWEELQLLEQRVNGGTH